MKTGISVAVTTGATLSLGLILAGCAQTPFGPMVQVMPGPGKSFEAFASDQAGCKLYAADQVKGQADASNQRAVGGALLGTVLGVGLGAATGNFGGVAGQGAALGASSGASVGAIAGAQQSSIDQVGIQQQYDNAFSQCMYSKGDQVPGFAAVSAAPGYPPEPARRIAVGPDPALVRGAQTELVRLHYLNGAADGEMGPNTAGAIRAFQQANGLRASGMVSQNLLARLQSTPTSAGAPDTGVATASSQAWVAPTRQQQAAGVTPASAPGSSSGWVAPKTANP